MSNNNFILIAEDESIISLDIKRILEKSGYTMVSIVRDGEALLNKIQKELPSLIIMDIYLNGRANGIELAHRIWEKNNIPVIFISGMDMKFLKKNLDFTKCAFVKKPFAETDLMEAVKKFF